MLKIINDQSQARKKKLADALCEIASEDAIGGLYQMLSDRSEFVVLFAMERIGDLALNDIQINVKYVVDTLLKFKDSECIKMACVRALGYSRNQVVIKNLVDCLRDKSSGVRYYAVDALTGFAPGYKPFYGRIYRMAHAPGGRAGAYVYFHAQRLRSGSHIEKRAYH